MVLPPIKYAELLREKIKKYHVNVWLLNTGWTGGAFGVGKRIPLELTRFMLKAALAGSLDDVACVQDPIFNLKIPSVCSNVPTEILIPENTWKNKSAFQSSAQKLAQLFKKNFEQFHDQTTAAVREAGPK